jgi:hypothetical protein
MSLDCHFFTAMVFAQVSASTHRSKGYPPALSNAEGSAAGFSGRVWTRWPDGRTPEDDRLLVSSAQKTIYQAVSTVNFKPTALVTATSVDRRGLPFADNAR